MMRPEQKKGKRGNSAVKYPGKLGRRRPPSNERESLAGLTAITGSARTAAEELLETVMDPIANHAYYNEGILLIAKRLGVKAPFAGLWWTASAFWQELSLKLLQAHVPYFMPPARRGRPRTLQAYFPVLENIITEIKTGDSPLMQSRRQMAEQLGMDFDWSSPFADWTIAEAYEDAAERLNVTPETVRREFTKWRRQRRGGNLI